MELPRLYYKRFHNNYELLWVVLRSERNPSSGLYIKKSGLYPVQSRFLSGLDNPDENRNLDWIIYIKFKNCDVLLINFYRIFSINACGILSLNFVASCY